MYFIFHQSNALLMGSAAQGFGFLTILAKMPVDRSMVLCLHRLAHPLYDYDWVEPLCN